MFNTTVFVIEWILWKIFVVNWRWRHILRNKIIVLQNNFTYINIYFEAYRWHKWRTSEDSWFGSVDEEIHATIKSLKNRNSPGEDNIINELIKYGGTPLWEEITRLILLIFEKGKIPEEWRRNVVIPIFKRKTSTW